MVLLIAKSAEDAIVIIVQMALNDHQSEYKKNHGQRKNRIIELKTNDAMLTQNKFLIQIVEKLTKKLSKLPQQL